MLLNYFLLHFRFHFGNKAGMWRRPVPCRRFCKDRRKKKTHTTKRKRDSTDSTWKRRERGAPQVPQRTEHACTARTEWYTWSYITWVDDLGRVEDGCIGATFRRRIRLVSLCAGSTCYLRMAKMSTGDFEVMQETRDTNLQTSDIPWESNQLKSDRMILGVSEPLKTLFCRPDRSRSACAKMKSLIAADQWLHSSLRGCVSPNRLFKPFEADTENKDIGTTLTASSLYRHSIITVVWTAGTVCVCCNSHNLCQESYWYSGIYSHMYFSCQMHF